MAVTVGALGGTRQGGGGNRTFGASGRDLCLRLQQATSGHGNVILRYVSCVILPDHMTCASPGSSPNAE